MTDGVPSIVDWINLPPGAKAESLWSCLHDAEVVSISSNIGDRTATFICEIEHLRRFRGLAEGVKFTLQLDEVHSVRVLRFAIWPGEFKVPPGVSRSEEASLVADYQSKGREESYTWSDLEASVTRENEQVLLIGDASLALSEEDAVALRLCCQLNDSRYHELCVRAGGLRISTSDGGRFTVEEFQSLGESYWEHWSRDRPRAAGLIVE